MAYRSPGGLVTAMESVMRSQPGAWVGWAGDAGDASEPFDEDDIDLRPVPLSVDDVRDYYEGFSNDTLWPIYHDVIVPASFHRDWWSSYQTVNQRFAEAIAEVGRPKVPASGCRTTSFSSCRPSCASCAPMWRIGWLNDIPFPPVELFAQVAVANPNCSTASSGPTSASSARPTPATSRAPAARRRGVPTKRDIVTVEEAIGGVRHRHPDLGRLQGPRGARPAT